MILEDIVRNAASCLAEGRRDDLKMVISGFVRDGGWARSGYVLEAIEPLARSGDFEILFVLLEEVSELRAAEIYAALAARLTGQPSCAQPLLQRALALEPHIADHYLALARLLFPLTLPTAIDVTREQFNFSNLRQATACLQHAVRIDPDSAEINARLGASLLVNQKFTEACFFLRTAIDQSPRLFEARLLIGRAYYRLGRLDEAERECATAAALIPDHQTARSYLQTVRADLEAFNAGKLRHQAAQSAITTHIPRTAFTRMRANSAPIIFTHFGFSNYLIYTLQFSRLFNQDKRVILLGDETNEFLKELGVEHYYFRDYMNSEEIDEFNNVYRFVFNEKTQWTGTWNKFIFLQWFIMFNFCRENNIDSFWHFDTDECVMSGLSDWEGVFSSYDCTDYVWPCGYVRKLDIVKGYIDKINELFARPGFVEGCRLPTGGGFNEQIVYRTFREEHQLNTFRIDHRIVNGCLFDVIATIRVRQEDCPFELDENGIKKYSFTKSGYIYVKEQKTGENILLSTINLGWMPIGTYKMFFENSIKRLLLT